jgi:hypothetical protein
VYRVEPPPNTTTLLCSRCQQVFRVPSHDVIAFRPEGVIGGAAAGLRAVVETTPVVALARPPVRRTSWLLWFLVAGLLALAVISLRRQRADTTAPPPVTPSAGAGHAREGELLLRRDDETSLKKARVEFSLAEALEPGNLDHRAGKAFAMLLLAGSMRAEADDLLADLSKTTFTAESLATLSDAERSAAVERAARLRSRLPKVTADSDSFVKDGLTLAHGLERPGVEASVRVQRALWLAAAFEHRLDQLQAPPLDPHGGSAASALPPEEMAWWHFARGYAYELNDPQPAGLAVAEKEIAAAVSLDSGNLRAQWELARLLRDRMPPDPRTEKLVKNILALNRDHEGAQREAARAGVAVAAAAH